MPSSPPSRRPLPTQHCTDLRPNPTPVGLYRRSFARDEHWVLGYRRGHVLGQDSRHSRWDGFVVIALPLFGSSRGKRRRSERLPLESE